MTAPPDPSKELPEVLEGARVPQPANPEMVFYEGPMTLRWGERSGTVDGSIRMKWSPRTEVEIEGDTDSPLMILDGADATIMPDGWSEPAKILVTGASVRSTSEGESGRLTALLNGRAVEGDATAPVDEIRFFLVNYHPSLGSPVRGSAVHPGAMWGARTSYDLGGWHLTLDRLYQLDDSLKEVRRDGGFAITHAGSLRRSDANTFTWADAKDVMDGLGSWFAFSRSFWVGPAFPSGCLKGSPVFRLHESVRLTPLPPSLRSWAPVDQMDELNPAVRAFLRRWSDPKWRDPLRHYVWWYVEANQTETADARIVLTHSALELAGWLYLVEKKRALSADGFKKLPGADWLRVLLGFLEIPTDIPDGFGDLADYAAARNRADGPGALYGVRNALVHPSEKSRTEVASAPRHMRFQAAELGVYYLELVLLGVLGYHGPIFHRSQLRGYRKERPVPWAVSED